MRKKGNNTSKKLILRQAKDGGYIVVPETVISNKQLNHRILNKRTNKVVHGNKPNLIQKIAMLWFVVSVLYGIYWMFDFKFDVSLSKEAKQALTPIDSVKRTFANLEGK